MIIANDCKMGINSPSFFSSLHNLQLKNFSIYFYHIDNLNIIYYIVIKV